MKTWLVNDGEKVHCIVAEKWNEVPNGALLFKTNNEVTACFKEWKHFKEVSSTEASHFLSEKKIAEVVAGRTGNEALLHGGAPDDTIAHPMQPIVIDDKGVVRFQQNAIIRHVVDCGSIDLNDIAGISFSREDRSQLAQLIGYSVSGWGGLSFVSDDDCEAANEKVKEILGTTEPLEVKPEDTRDQRKSRES